MIPKHLNRVELIRAYRLSILFSFPHFTSTIAITTIVVTHPFTTNSSDLTSSYFFKFFPALDFLIIINIPSALTSYNATL